MALLNFNASQYAQPPSRELIPEGWYIAIMDDSEMKPSKMANGAYLQCRFAIIEGPYAGRKIFNNLNLHNSNELAVKVAYDDLKRITTATEYPNPRSPGFG